MSWNIFDIKTWPPGTLMGFDNRDQLRRYPTETKRAGYTPHTGIGIVVHNDGVKIIHVVWDSNCKDAFSEYNVSNGLNPQVIYRIG